MLAWSSIVSLAVRDPLTSCWPVQRMHGLAKKALASCWPVQRMHGLAKKALASCWPVQRIHGLAKKALASCWPVQRIHGLAKKALASCWPVQRMHGLVKNLQGVHCLLKKPSMLANVKNARNKLSDVVNVVCMFCHIQLLCVFLCV